MSKTYYEVLGVKKGSSSDEIRSAYRRIVLEHHPDRSSNSGSPAIFIAATEAYEVLGDQDRRFRYNQKLDQEDKRAAETPRARINAAPKPTVKPSSTKTGTSKRESKLSDSDSGNTRVSTKTQNLGVGAKPTVATVAADVARLTVLFGRGQNSQAESLARGILNADPRQPIPYAILGDLLRARNNIDEAAKMYAYAAQFDPRNPTYQQRYEELLATTRVVDSKNLRLQTQDMALVAPAVGGFVVFSAGVYLALSKETAIFPGISLVSSWTLGLVVMMFLCGVSVGASLSIGNLLDRFSGVSTNSVGKIGPPVALAFVSAVNFWIAVLMYAGLGILQNAFNFSTSRLLGAVGATTLVLTFAAIFSQGLNPAQVFFWGGNLIYIGSLCGWIVADSFRS